MDYSLRFCECLNDGLIEDGSEYEIIFAIPKDPIFDGIEDISRLLELGKGRISIYNYTVKKQNIQIDGITRGYCVLDEGETSEKYDFVFVMSDISPIMAPFFWEVPNIVIAHDYIQKYVPDLFSEREIDLKYENQKRANTIFVTSLPSYEDAVYYAKNKRKNVVITPYLLKLELENEDSQNCSSDYFLWSTNTTKHKNHLRAINALNEYYINGGMIDCYITGTNTEFFLESANLAGAPIDQEYVRKVKKEMDKPEIRKHVKVFGRLRKDEYLKMLCNSQYVFHPGYGDNGNGTVFDAGSYQVPSLSSDYPAMRYMSYFTGLPIQWMDPFNAESMTRAMFAMEKKALSLRSEMPNRDALKEKDYKKQGKKLYRIIKDVLMEEGICI